MNPFSSKIRLSFVVAGALAGCPGLSAAATATTADWQRQQRFEVSATGLVKLSLPVETLDAARPALEDLRLYDSQGNEVAYAIERPRPAGRVVQPARSFAATLAGNRTTVTVETGIQRPIAGVTLETPASGFIKSVQVEGSADGKEWQAISSGHPIFRQPNGASQLFLPVAPRTWPWLKFTVDDRRSAPVPFTGARVHAAEPEPAPIEPVAITITDRYENPGVTRLDLKLGGANLDLASLEVETSDPLFTRQVTVAVPQVSEDAVREQNIAQGLIYRVAVEGESSATNLSVSLDSPIRSKQLILLVKNEDSQPLTIPAVRAWRRPVYLTFYARQAGVYRLLTGNARGGAPSYDLASLAGSLRRTPVSRLPISALEANPDYRAPEVLPGIQEGTTAVDVSEWKFRKPLKLASSGAQQLELDLDVLSHAQAGFGDLRLVRAGKQVPYILQRTSISRRLTPTVSATTDTKDPKISRWTLKFDHSNLPLSTVRCTARTPLFQRDMTLYEELRDERGETYRRTLASAAWIRTPDNTVKEFAFSLDGSPRQEALFLETHNGDNPAIELGGFQADYPATRVLFKDGSGEDLFLYYGNAHAVAPRYDLSLVAGQLLLAADKSSATVGSEQQVKASAWADTHVAGKGGWIFWGMLGVVVLVLLAIISRLLPKGPDSNEPQTPAT